MKKGLLAILIMGMTVRAISQITWNSLPRDFQFVPRNINTNKGKLIFEGTVTQTGYTSITLTHKGSAGIGVKYTIPLTYNSFGQAYFYQTLYIQAGKINHSIEISLSNGSGNSVYSNIKNIACGDAFLISGQSNSVANSYNGLANPVYGDSFIRSYGSSSPGVAGALNDTGWYVADGDGIYTKGCIGQWGLVFARYILDSASIPVCIINAGVGGTPITFHQKNPYNTEDLNSNYGRMLYRARKAGIYDKIRGIFWFQGESDGSNAVLHDSLFRKMHADWFKDFPGLERVAVVQVRNGCGGPTLELREKQRLFKNLNRTHVISANGLNWHDGCHYWFKNGYEKLGVLLFHQLKTALYSMKSIPENQPLNPYLVYFGNSAKTELCVEFTPLNATLKTDAGFHRLFLIEGGTVSITGGYLKNNKIYLTLSGSGCDIKSLSYDGFSGTQPWVRTTEDATLISFYRFPATPVKPLPNITICKGQKVKLGADSMPGCTYFWKGVLSGLNSTRANPAFSVPRSEKFLCIIKSKATGCVYDTVSQNVVVDTVSPATLPEVVYTCTYDSVTIGNKNKDWDKGWWSFKGNQYPGFTVRSRDTGRWIFKAVSFSGCITSDTLLLKNYKSAQKYLPINIELCSGKQKVLRAPVKSSAWKWNGNPGADSFAVYSSYRSIELVYNDSNGCYQTDSAYIIELIPGTVTLEKKYSFCKGETLSLTRPIAYINWQIDGVTIVEGICKVSREGNFNLLLTDKKGCTASHNFQTSMYAQNKLELANSGICKNDSITFQAPGWLSVWYWNGMIFPKKFALKTDGVYYINWRDSNQCKGEHNFILETAEKVLFTIPADTFFCRGDSMEFTQLTNSRGFLYFNGNIVNDPFIIKNPGKYTFTAYLKPFCSNQHELTVTEKLCVNHTAAVSVSPLKIAQVQNGIQLTLTTGKYVQFCIVAGNSQLITEGTLQSGKSTEISLTPGIYFIGFSQSPEKKYQYFKTAVY